VRRKGGGGEDPGSEQSSPLPKHKIWIAETQSSSGKQLGRGENVPQWRLPILAPPLVPGTMVEVIGRKSQLSLPHEALRAKFAHLWTLR
jgi:hypothetical protein